MQRTHWKQCTVSAAAGHSHTKPLFNKYNGRQNNLLNYYLKKVRWNLSFSHFKADGNYMYHY